MIDRLASVRANHPGMIPTKKDIHAFHITGLCKQINKINTIDKWLDLFPIELLMYNAYGRRTGPQIIKHKKEDLQNRAQILITKYFKSKPSDSTQIVLMDGHGRFIHFLLQEILNHFDKFVSHNIQKIKICLVDHDPTVVEFHRMILPTLLQAHGIEIIFEHLCTDIFEFLKNQDEQTTVPYLNFCGLGGNEHRLCEVSVKFSQWLISCSMDARNKKLKGQNFREYISSRIRSDLKYTTSSNFFTFISV